MTHSTWPQGGYNDPDTWSKTQKKGDSIEGREQQDYYVEKPFYFGLGLGMDFGGIGTKLEFMLLDYAGIFAGIGEENIGNVKNKYIEGSLRGLRQMGVGYFDYHMQQTVHSTFTNNPNYMPWQYQYRGTKLSIAGYKSLFYGLKLNLN